MNFEHEFELDTEAELKTIRRRLRRRSAAIVAASVALAAVILLGIVYLGLPAAEKQYWNPEENTYNVEFGTDLELDFRAYTELFCDGLIIDSVVAEKNGFASYSLWLQCFDSVRGGSSSYSYGSLVKDELSLPYGLMHTVPLNIFEWATVPGHPGDTEWKESTRQRLEEMPDYVSVYAAVSFEEDRTMEELMGFMEELDEEGGRVDWAGIRNSEWLDQRLPLCGIKPESSGIIWEGINDDYPLFELKGRDNVSAEDLEQHFRSLLTYSRDRAEAGRGVSEIHPSYYEEVLSYVDEKGIMTYGCYISASPETVVKLLDAEAISQAWVQDVWIKF